MMEVDFESTIGIPPGCHEKRYRHGPLIIGVGGAGFRIVDRIATKDPELSPCLVIDTEPRQGSMNPGIWYFTLGQQTKARPFHQIPPEWARQAVIDDRKRLEKELVGGGLTVVVAGLGGGVGTGAGPAVAGLCKSSGAFTVVLVSMPFSFEGPVRTRTAEEGVESIRSVADVTVVIRYEHVLRRAAPRARLHEVYEMANEIFALMVKSIPGIGN